MLNKSFTIIEVLVATFMITVGIGAAITLVNQTTAFTQVTSSRLVASYLAQEGLEIVKNIRDTNLLKIHKGVGGVSWDDGLTGCMAGCEGDYTSTTLSSYADRKLKIDGGFYKYSASGAETSFKRKITITLDGSDILKVSVEVFWEERGREHKVIAQENLYKWLY